MAKQPKLKPASTKLSGRAGSKKNSSGRRLTPKRSARDKASTLPAGYLDSSKLVFEDSSDDGDDWDFEDSADEGPISKRVKLAVKEGQFVGSIPPPPFTPPIPTLGCKEAPPQLDDDVLAANDGSDSVTSTIMLSPIELNIEVPKNFKGPIQLHINLGPLLVSSAQRIDSVASGQVTLTKGVDIRPANAKNAPALTLTSDKLEPTNGPASSVGFKNLPAELRNRVYRMVFRDDGAVVLGFRSDFSHSGQFLRTCKQVLLEGRTILYGENEYHFRRESKPRGLFFQRHWNEIGYEDVHRFLEVIGPINVSLLRDVRFALDDATPSQAPGVVHDDRRFTNDKHLRYSLQLFAKYGQLDHLKLEVNGRRRLDFQEYEFLAGLKKVKANALGFGPLGETDEESDFYVNRYLPYLRGRNVDKKVKLELECAILRIDTRAEDDEYGMRK